MTGSNITAPADTDGASPDLADIRDLRGEGHHVIVANTCPFKTVVLFISIQT
jgi:hypothetical protein